MTSHSQQRDLQIMLAPIVNKHSDEQRFFVALANSEQNWLTGNPRKKVRKLHATVLFQLHGCGRQNTGSRLTAQAMSGYYRAGIAAVVRRVVPSDNESLPVSRAEVFAAAVAWSELTDSDVTFYPATPLSLVGGSVRLYSVLRSSSVS